jgi:mRNA interferase MazF
MNVRRGDIVLATYPFSTGVGAKRRPVLVLQNDRDNQRLTSTIVAQITSNLRRAHEPTHLLIEITSAEGRQTGLLSDSLISFVNLATIHQTLISRTIGSLSAALMARAGACLKAALELP